MIFLLLYRHRGATPVVVTHGIGRKGLALPGRTVSDAGIVRSVGASATRPIGMPRHRLTIQGRTR